MISVVNGYVCRSGCDEAVARKGRDPRNPTDNPVKAEQLAIRDGAAVKPGAGVVSFGRDASTVQTGLDIAQRGLPNAPARADRLLDVMA